MNDNEPRYSMSAPTDMDAQFRIGPLPWSGLAIAAFVLSLVGFFGFTAILAIIFAIAGLVVTRNYQRRGRGLAIAAIPVALVTGFLGLVLVYGSVTFMQMYETAETFTPALSGSAEKSAENARKFHALGSPDFQEEVTVAELDLWLAEVRRKHGTLVRLERDDSIRVVTSDSRGRPVLNMQGKFTNGTALVSFTFAPQSMFRLKLDDVEVEGDSPRASVSAPEVDSP